MKFRPQQTRAVQGKKGLMKGDWPLRVQLADFARCGLWAHEQLEAKS